MGLACKDTHEALVRLLVSSLHYSEDGPARTVLSKILTGCSEVSVGMCKIEWLFAISIKTYTR